MESNDHQAGLITKDIFITWFQCFDLGFHLSLGKVLRTYLAAESRAQASWQQGLCAIEGAVDALDPLGDKSRMMEANPAAYCPPLSFDYQPHEGDEVRGFLASCSRFFAFCSGWPLFFLFCNFSVFRYLKSGLRVH